jgi:cytochrome b involved in lipid metabolism
LSPTIVVTPSTTTGSVVATPTRDTRCLVVVDGLQYNLTQFVKLHSGGDIFQCGTDMSSSFHNQHPNNYLDILAKYRI